MPGGAGRGGTRRGLRAAPTAPPPPPAPSPPPASLAPCPAPHLTLLPRHQPVASLQVRRAAAGQGQVRPIKRRDRPLKRGGRPGPRPAPSRSVATHVAESGVLRRRRLRRRPRGATRGVATAPDRCCAGRGTRGAGITAMALNRSSLPAFRATVRSVITGKSFEAPVHKKITLCC